jgi:hypothetical protein
MASKPHPPLEAGAGTEERRRPGAGAPMRSDDAMLHRNTGSWGRPGPTFSKIPLNELYIFQSNLPGPLAADRGSSIADVHARRPA